MELSQENLYVIECFRKNFSKEQYKRVIIYGIGINTRAILSAADIGNVVGLMDASCEGETIMGYPVLAVEEAVSKGDCVVIVARNCIVPVIFERIRALEEQWKFPIYNLQGERLIYKKAVQYENDHPYWEKNEEDLLQRIQEHQTISFDVFDTLITRRCMQYTDIFLMAEANLKQLDIPTDGFAAARREAEIELEAGYPKIDEIYSLLQTRMNWSDADTYTAKEMELALELDNVIPRHSMREIYRKTLSMGKKVILVSDMYLPLERMVQLLEKCDIRDYDRLYISCEEKADKRSGKLFQRVLEEGYTDILHIGDNEVCDGASAKACGIQSYTIWSTYEMLVHSSLHGLLAHADTLEKHCVIGGLQDKLFDNPFSLGGDKGMVTVRDNYTAGYVFLAPIIRCFLPFLIDVLKMQQPDKILFCARDGFLIWKLYQRMIDAEKDEMPEGFYFKTSRRAISVAAIKDLNDILSILQKPYNTTMGELLNVRFGIVPEEGDSEAGKAAVYTRNPEEAERYILKYQKQILQNAEAEREAYYKYMQKNHLLSRQRERLAVYDFCSGGTIQHYLSELVDADVRGIYFATVNLPNQFFEDDSNMTTLLGSIGQYNTKYHMAKHYMFLEAVLTDEHGTLIRFDEKGQPVYDEAENNRRNYKAIEEIQRGILDYCADTLHEKWLDDYAGLKEFADSILGVIFQPEICKISGEVKDSVKAESKYDFLPAFSAWNAE